jgi:ribosomal protein L17
MTCYFRHLQDVFRKAGIVITDENRKEVDRAIHSIVGVKYKDCPATWREVKKRIATNDEDFVSKLRETIRKQTHA